MKCIYDIPYAVGPAPCDAQNTRPSFRFLGDLRTRLGATVKAGESCIPVDIVPDIHYSLGISLIKMPEQAL